MSAVAAQASLLYVFSRAPYSVSAGQEALDAALLGAAFEGDVSVLFLHDGIFQVVAGQSTAGSPLKQYTKAFAALNDFGVEQIFVHDLSLAARGVNADELLVGAKVISTAEIARLVSAQYRVFTF